MRTEKKSVFEANRIISIVDFIKWTSTFGVDALKQTEVPLRGVRFTAAMWPLFGVAMDDDQPMLTMHQDEAPWLAHLPIQMALVGFGEGDGLILVTEEFTLFDQPFPSTAIDLYLPYEHRKTFNTPLLGFCHLSAQGIKPINRMVPVFTPERYENERRVVKEASLFGGM